jgi:protein-S-isoprenylcysteine O-methyltransferase Ste14
MSKRILNGFVIVLALAFILILSKPNFISLVTGGIIVFLGQAVRVWAGGHLMRNQEITTSGPYAYLRDPFYLGRLFLIIGFCIMAWGYAWIILVISLSVFFTNYIPRKYRKEMTRLEKIFGQDYKDYASYTRSLIPRIKPYPKAKNRPWSFELFLKENKEHYFVMGTLLFALLLIGRYLFRP